MEVVVAALYKFVPLEDYRQLREPLLDVCQRAGTCGTLLLAAEGINGTIAGSRKAIDAVLSYLREDPRLADLPHKESFDDHLPFYRMKVKLKREIVTIGVPDVDPGKRVGQYVKPQDWNRLVSDPEVVLIDTRNQYEYDIGTFSGAVDPQTTSFREFPEYVRRELDPARHRKVAMFCTGGIRCEKSTSYVKSLGIEDVFHLQGGILKYLETVPKADSLWEGECFVFDERVSVGHGLEVGDYQLCHACRHPVSAADRDDPKFEDGVSCPRCHGTFTEAKMAALRERQKQVRLAKARGETHIGDDVVMTPRPKATA